MRGKMFMAVGAAAMYYLDPQQGRIRRARTRNRIVSVRHRFDHRAEDPALTTATHGITDPLDVTVDMPYSIVDGGRSV